MSEENQNPFAIVTDEEITEEANAPVEELTELDSELETQEEDIQLPTRKWLSENVMNSELHGYEFEWGQACKLFAKEHGIHFLGFSMKDGEPMFKAVE